jgi:hypothetical protein
VRFNTIENKNNVLFLIGRMSRNKRFIQRGVRFFIMSRAIKRQSIFCAQTAIVRTARAKRENQHIATNDYQIKNARPHNRCKMIYHV